jgi:hypothetical protein
MALDPWEVQPLSKLDSVADETYRSVGEALSSWEKFEWYLAMLFGFLAGGGPGFVASGGSKIISHPALRAFGTIVAFNGRCDLLRAASETYLLIHPHQKDNAATLTKLLNMAGSFAARRNEIAHGVVTQEEIDGIKGWCLTAAQYSAKKRSIELRMGYYYPTTTTRYQYSSREIDHYRVHFRRLEDAVYRLLELWFI